MPKILDDQLFDMLQEYESVKEIRLKWEKQEKELRLELDKKLGDYDSTEIEVGALTTMLRGSENDTEFTDGYLVKYTPTERRSISREKLIERGVSLEVLLYATEVTQSRRLTFKRQES